MGIWGTPHPCPPEMPAAPSRNHWKTAVSKRGHRVATPSTNSPGLQGQCLGVREPQRWLPRKRTSVVCPWFSHRVPPAAPGAHPWTPGAGGTMGLTTKKAVAVRRGRSSSQPGESSISLLPCVVQNLPTESDATGPLNPCGNDRSTSSDRHKQHADCF